MPKRKKKSVRIGVASDRHNMAKNIDVTDFKSDETCVLEDIVEIDDQALYDVPIQTKYIQTSEIESSDSSDEEVLVSTSFYQSSLFAISDAVDLVYFPNLCVRFSLNISLLWLMCRDGRTSYSFHLALFYEHCLILIFTSNDLLKHVHYCNYYSSMTS